ncbi:MAG: hypothetical protein HYZ28_24105 [Myxococcales bacterium]|nr:hypothetical protein [Myxococcales bacterium]
MVVLLLVLELLLEQSGEDLRSLGRGAELVHDELQAFADLQRQVEVLLLLGLPEERQQQGLGLLEGVEVRERVRGGAVVRKTLWITGGGR